MTYCLRNGSECGLGKAIFVDMNFKNGTNSRIYFNGLGMGKCSELPCVYESLLFSDIYELLLKRIQKNLLTDSIGHCVMFLGQKC